MEVQCTEIDGIPVWVERSHAQVVATEIATHRLRQWVRPHEGVSYPVSSAYDPLSSQQAHRAMGEPAAIYDAVWYAGAQELVGERAETPEEMDALRAMLTPEAIARVVRDAFDGLLVSAPPGTLQLGGRFVPYPIDSPAAIKGKRFTPKDKERKETLVVGKDGVAIEGESIRAVSYVEAVAHLTWDDGSVGLYEADGFYVLVDPADWKKGEQAADDVRSHLDGGRAVDVSADFERVGAVSVSRCASLRHLERQLAA